jgi:putative heme-binding domain-containing protein
MQRARIVLLLAIAAIFVANSRGAIAQEAQWIWTSEHPEGSVPRGSAYFRKSIRLPAIEQAVLTIAADDAYELYLNGRLVGKGESVKNFDRYDLTQLMVAGRNVLAVRVENRVGPTAAFAARVQVKPTGSEWRNYSTNSTWRTSLENVRQWQGTYFNDSRWTPAAQLGELGKTAPWDRLESLPGTVDKQNRLENLATQSERFTVQPGFSVQRILDHAETGSLIAMAFNEFGHAIASREGGPLLLIYDSDKDGMLDKVREYCDLVKNIQGILPLNGDVLVTGDGPEGSGIYKLVDADRDGTLEQAEKLIGFQGSPGEHGAHQLTLGPDGYVYVIIGNHALIDGDVSGSSPYRVWYEGDLLSPKFEDPGGHARGIKAPGGTIVRIDLASNRSEIYAGGIRNAYDLAFHPEGGLFIHDSDMESDTGMTWYRPTNVFEVSAGAEMGWRSGWSKWPEYFVDRIPSLFSSGRGSPTGAIVYDHYQFPAQYQRSLFLADWSEGRILSVSLEKSGATYKANATTFLSGQPLNVTDLDVGPDGALYFCTGGRGTNGSIYRVIWEDKKPEDMDDLGNGISAIIRQPQLSSAWARQKVAILKKEIGDGWEETIAGVAYSPDNPARYRVRALELMQLLGPVPSVDMLVELSRSPNEAVRAKSANLLGLQKLSDNVETRLQEMLRDTDPMVQRLACESLTRMGGVAGFESLTLLLASEDRHLAGAARNLLASTETATWKNALLNTENPRVLAQAALALMSVEPTRENALEIAVVIGKTMDGFVSDRDFVDLLRALQVTLTRAELAGTDVPSLSMRITREFPTGEPRINRELIRLAVYLQNADVADKAVAYLGTNAPLAERVHVAMHLTRLNCAWSASQRFTILKFLETAQEADAGSAYPLYLMQATAAFGKEMSLDEARIFVSEGKKWPNAALTALYKYPADLTSDDIRILISLDRSIDQSGIEEDRYKRLKTGITAVLAQCGNEVCEDYLREVWRRSPDRRNTVALGLAQSPKGENWSYLVRSIPILDPSITNDVLNALTSVNQAPDDPDAFRQTILIGLRQEGSGLSAVSSQKLMEHWTSMQLDADKESPMVAWQAWFSKTYPNALPAELPTGDADDRWTLEELEAYLIGDDLGLASGEAGKLAYSKAQCADCHRFANEGSAIGPDLNSVAKRFTRREFIESVLYPSHVISNQYASKRVVTVDGQVLTGITMENANGTYTIRMADKTERIVPEEDVEELLPSKLSLMPSGLFNELTLEEIRDLMAYMGYLPSANVAEQPSSPPTISR